MEAHATAFTIAYSGGGLRGSNAEFIGDEIPVANEFTCKRATMIVVIVGDGTALKLLMDVQRHRLDVELRRLGHTRIRFTFRGH